MAIPMGAACVARETRAARRAAQILHRFREAAVTPIGAGSPRQADEKPLVVRAELDRTVPL